MKSFYISKCRLTGRAPRFTIAPRYGVNDDERAARIDALVLKLSQARARRAALLLEAREFEARIDEIRAAYGNPYFYSRMDPAQHAGESVAQYTGDKAHQPGRRIALAFIETNRELSVVREELRALRVYDE